LRGDRYIAIRQSEVLPGKLLTTTKMTMMMQAIHLRLFGLARNPEQILNIELHCMWKKEEASISAAGGSNSIWARCSLLELNSLKSITSCITFFTVWEETASKSELWISASDSSSSSGWQNKDLVVGLGLAFSCLTIFAEIGGKKGERSQKKILTIEIK
jgi:hypothetical protein